MALPMVQIYFKLVQAKSKTIEQVPVHLQAEVQALLDAEQSV